MTAKSFIEAWNAFFFREQSPIPIALFRVAYGVVVIATILLLRPDWLAWYGPHAWISLSTMQAVEPGPRLNLFAVIPQSDGWVQAVFWLFLASAACLTIGLLTRLNSVIVFLCLASIQQRNLFIIHGGDTFLRVAGFFLMFAPAGAALSVDRLIRIWRGKEGVQIRPRRPWAQRMIQFELSLLYFVSFCWKVEGISWVQGTALYYVFHLDELRRFPVPSWLLQPTVLKLGTWFALALEFALGILIWVKELRYPLLAIGVLFHLSLEYSLNVPMFQWDVLSAYVLFIDAADLERVWNWIRSRAGKYLGEQVTVIYDGSSERLLRIANVLGAMDIFGRLSLADLRDTQTRHGITPEKARSELLVATGSAVRHGIDGQRAVAAVVPLLWPIWVLLVIRRFWASGITASEKPR
ncbi:MAG: HTTM domain-containing protein [Candidatus Acidiferrales bacterium]